MRKRFWLVSTLCIFLCGYVLFVSYEVSGAAAWSFVVSSVNHSPWETVKPFAWVYMFWSFIELSVLRPSLLHYVAARILSLHLFVLLSLAVLNLLLPVLCGEGGILGVIGSILFLSQAICARMVRSRCRWELLFLPIIVSFVILFGCLMFCTFYPPPVPLFWSVSL